MNGWDYHDHWSSYFEYVIYYIASMVISHQFVSPYVPCFILSSDTYVHTMALGMAGLKYIWVWLVYTSSHPLGKWIDLAIPD